MKAKEIEHEGFKYCYHIFDGGKSELDPILVVNGAFQNLDSLKNIFGFFIEKTTVIYTDLPGTGTAEYIPEKYSIEFLCDSIYQILIELSIDKIYLVSASYGTAIAYKFTQKYPERVSKLVLIGTMKEIPEHAKLDYSKSVILAEKGNLTEFSKLILKILFNDNSIINDQINNFKLVRDLLKRQLMKLDNLSLSKYVSNIKRLLNVSPLEFQPPPNVSTLIFTGEFDPLTPPDLCRKFAQELPNSIFTSIKGADHLCHFEQPNLMIEIIYKFGIDQDLRQINGFNKIEYFKK